ncbi:MAG: peptidase M48 [Ponticaulis sp.]|mgnify:CR=1 FL=1|nr:peptidase M48 [Ponticaulis sp.]
MWNRLKFRLILILLAMAGLAIYWFVSQKPVGYTDRRQVLTTTIEQENELGLQAYAQILSQEGENVVCSGNASSCSSLEREILERVQAIGEDLRLAAIAYEDELIASGEPVEPKARDFEWTFNVIQSDQPNAFCLPGGYVAIYTGILDVTGNFDGEVTVEDVVDLDKLAVMMGHEIAHALARHGGERMSQGKILQVGQIAVGVAGGDQRIMEAFGLAAQTGVLLPFSRQHEAEADKIGLELLVRACYDPREAPELWERMGTLGQGQKPPEFLSTHPSSERRAENFREWMPDAVSEYVARGCPALSGR